MFFTPHKSKRFLQSQWIRLRQRVNCMWNKIIYFLFSLTLEGQNDIRKETKETIFDPYLIVILESNLFQVCQEVVIVGHLNRDLTHLEISRYREILKEWRKWSKIESSLPYFHFPRLVTSAILSQGAFTVPLPPPPPKKKKCISW